MAGFIWKTEMIQNIQKLYAQKEMENPEYTMQEVERKMLESGIIVKEESSEYRIDGAAEIIIEVLLTWDAHMRYKCEGKKDVDFYLKKDWIVRSVRDDETQELQLLPSITYAIGSVADSLWEIVSGANDCNLKKIFIGSLDENNYLEELLDLIDEENYRKVLLQEPLQTLFAEGETKTDYPGFFMAVKIMDGNAYYYKQEAGTVSYGENSRSNLVNNICHWMLYAHRDLISKVLNEGENAL